MNVCKRDLTITVAAGSGEVASSSVPGGAIHGLLTMIGLKAPAPAAEYDLQIYDEAGYLLYAENDLIGNVTISLEKICNSALTVKLLNATSDGSYSVRLYNRG